MPKKGSYFFKFITGLAIDYMVSVLNNFFFFMYLCFNSLHYYGTVLFEALANTIK